MHGKHISETLAYGISIFVLRTRRPFHPECFIHIIEKKSGGIIISKGYFSPLFIRAWSEVEDVSTQGIGGVWWANEPRNQWAKDDELQEIILSKRVDRVGDARQELGFTGMGINEDHLRKKLNTALLTEREIAEGPFIWTQYLDPFEPCF